MFASADSRAILNSIDGFSGEIGFYFSSSQLQPDEVINVYDGLDGTGLLLLSLGLNVNATAGCDDSPFCRFDFTSSGFSGIAHSMDFSVSAGNVAFDNITLSPVPEPQGLALMLGGIGVAGATVRRRRGG